MLKGQMMVTIEDSDKVDVIAVNKNNGKVILGITDHLVWDNSADHLLLLKKKINLYLQFIESGQIYSSYPEARNRLIEITHYTKFPIDNIGKNFIKKANEFTKGLGITITTIQYEPNSMDSV